MAVAEPLDTAQPAVTARRAYALDALRGFAMLMMVFSGLIPFGLGPHGMLPAWMYHAQEPPPTHEFNPSLPGITWVDLVFPFFLFAMGTAIPLALSRRIEKGAKTSALALAILQRGLLLAAFSLFDAHIRPYGFSDHPGNREWGLALLGFALVFPMFARLPEKWPVTVQRAVRAAGWIGALVFLASVRYMDGHNWAWNLAGLRKWLDRGDVILLVLANVAVFGSLTWLFTRGRTLARLAPLGLLLAIKLSSTVPGWGQALWNWSPTPWLYRMEFVKYLFIIIPGTIAGDLLLSWMRAPADGAARRWSSGRLATLALLMACFVPVLLVGLKTRHPLTTLLVSVPMLALAAWLAREPGDATERLLNNLFQWGAYWLLLGLCFEPFEGGIKKDHATFSYFFVISGLALFVLISFTIVIDVFQHRRAVRLLVENGKNPMIIYVGVTNLVQSVVAWQIAGFTLNGWVTDHFPIPWQGAAWGAVQTLALAGFVMWCTRRKVFLRT